MFTLFIQILRLQKRKKKKNGRNIFVLALSLLYIIRINIYYFGNGFHYYFLIRMHRKRGQFTSKTSEGSTVSDADDSKQDEGTQETL